MKMVKDYCVDWPLNARITQSKKCAYSRSITDEITVA